MHELPEVIKIDLNQSRFSPAQLDFLQEYAGKDLEDPKRKKSGAISGRMLAAYMGIALNRKDKKKWPIVTPEQRKELADACYTADCSIEVDVEDPT